MGKELVIPDSKRALTARPECGGPSQHHFSGSVMNRAALKVSPRHGPWTTRPGALAARALSISIRLMNLYAAIAGSFPPWWSISQPAPGRRPRIMAEGLACFGNALRSHMLITNPWKTQNHLALTKCSGRGQCSARFPSQAPEHLKSSLTLVRKGRNRRRSRVDFGECWASKKRHPERR